MGVNLAWLMFDEETLTVVRNENPLRSVVHRISQAFVMSRWQVGNDWKSVVSKCIQSNLQPCVIIYQVQELNGPKTVI